MSRYKTKWTRQTTGSLCLCNKDEWSLGHCLSTSSMNPITSKLFTNIGLTFPVKPVGPRLPNCAFIVTETKDVCSIFLIWITFPYPNCQGLCKICSLKYFKFYILIPNYIFFSEGCLGYFRLFFQDDTFHPPPFQNWYAVTGLWLSRRYIYIILY